MAVYIDNVHLTADSKKELHEFAEKLGLKRCWYHTAKKHPHYDVVSRENWQKAVELGAKRVSSKELFIKAKALRDAKE